MRILYMGTASFAIPSLKVLLASAEHSVIGVVTQPDRPSGRGRQMHASPIKQMAQDAEIPVYQPEKVRSEEFVSIVRNLAPDAIVVAAFGQLIPKSILDIPKYGNINVHGSLLPKYRGAAPVHYALFNGDAETGVTTMLMSPGLDSGPILLQSTVKILPEDDEETLEARLAQVGAELLIRTLRGLERGEIVPIEQDESLVTYSPSIKRSDCAIDWSSDASEIVNRVRGCTPRPGAYSGWHGGTLKVWSCSIGSAESEGGSPGEVILVDAEGIAVRAGSGSVILRELQPENKRRMQASEFARGYRIVVGSAFHSA
jgi:methionyl-tRNA formyltransferase